MAATKEYMRRYFLERKLSGICKNCPSPLEVHSYYCAVCADKIRTRMKARYEARRAKGICTRCRNKALPNMSFCKDHSAENNKYIKKENLEMIEKKPQLTGEQKEAIKTMKRDRKLIGEVIRKLGSNSKVDNTAISNYYYGKG